MHLTLIFICMLAVFAYLHKNIAVNDQAPSEQIQKRMKQQHQMCDISTQICNFALECVPYFVLEI